MYFSLRQLLGVAIVVFATAATSCSLTQGAHPEAACNGPGISSEQVKIGLVVSDSGVGSSALSSARSGVEARIGLANEEGGIHGRKIDYLWRDDANSPSQSTRVVDDLVAHQAVFGLVTVSTAFGGSLDSLTAQNVPVVGFGLPSLAKYQNMFSSMYLVSPTTLGRYIQAEGGRKVGIVITGTSAFTLETIASDKMAFQAIGLDTTDVVTYARSTDSPARVVQQLAAAGADSLLGFTTPEDFADIVQAARSANLRLATAVSLTGYDRGLLPALGPALAGVTFPVYFRPFEAGGPALDRYRSAMARFAPETGQPEQQWAVLAYIYTDMFLRGLDLAGDCPSREGFISSLRKVSKYDAGGLIEPVDLADVATQPLSCYAFVRIGPAGTEFQVAYQRFCADGRSE